MRDRLRRGMIQEMSYLQDRGMALWDILHSRVIAWIN